MFAACSVDEPTLSAPQQEQQLQAPEGALAGQLFVKFDASVSQVLEQAGLTKSGADCPMTRSGVLTVDEILDLVDGYEIERVFPVDSRTEETARHEGLHLWYIVRFSENHPVNEVASKLSRLGEVSRVEYNRTLKRASASKAVPLSADVLSPAVKAVIAGHDDPLLKYQWHLVNNGADQELPVAKPASPKSTFLEGADVGMKKVWENQEMKGHPSIIVAVLDEGVCFSHPDLANSMWINDAGTGTMSPVTGTVNGHDYVDLGLPSGTKWASWNLGANTPEEYGDCYAWAYIDISTFVSFSSK